MLARRRIGIGAAANQRGLAEEEEPAETGNDEDDTDCLDDCPGDDPWPPWRPGSNAMSDTFVRRHLFPDGDLPGAC